MKRSHYLLTVLSVTVVFVLLACNRNGGSSSGDSSVPAPLTTTTTPAPTPPPGHPPGPAVVSVKALMVTVLKNTTTPTFTNVDSVWLQNPINAQIDILVAATRVGTLDSAQPTSNLDFAQSYMFRNPTPTDIVVVLEPHDVPEFHGNSAATKSAKSHKQ